MGSEFGGSEMYDDPGSVAASQMEDWGEDGGEGGDGGDDDGAFDEYVISGLAQVCTDLHRELAQALMEQLEEVSSSVSMILEIQADRVGVRGIRRRSSICV